MRYLTAACIALFFFSSASSQKVVLLEKWTNYRCGNCPQGAIVLQDMVDTYDNVIWVSHYKPWMMTLNNDQTNQLFFDLGVWGNPLLVVDREDRNNSLFSTMGSWQGIIDQQLNKEQVATVEINNVFTNAFERTIDFDVAIGFLKDQDLADYRITAMIVEDLVTGEPQDSYFNNTVGHPLFGLGDPIWNYKHRNVVRHIFDDAWGTPDVLPSEPKAGDEAVHHYQFQIPDDHKIENISIVCSITKYNPDDLTEIDALQAAEVHLTEGIITSTKELADIIDIEIFPNPTTDYFDVKMDQVPSAINIIDASGKTILSQTNLDSNPRIDISQLTEGMYVVQVLVDDHMISRSLSILGR